MGMEWLKIAKKAGPGAVDYAGGKFDQYQGAYKGRKARMKYERALGDEEHNARVAMADERAYREGLIQRGGTAPGYEKERDAEMMGRMEKALGRFSKQDVSQGAYRNMGKTSAWAQRYQGEAQNMMDKYADMQYGMAKEKTQYQQGQYDKQANTYGTQYDRMAGIRKKRQDLMTGDVDRYRQQEGAGAERARAGRDKMISAVSG